MIIDDTALTVSDTSTPLPDRMTTGDGSLDVVDGQPTSDDRSATVDTATASDGSSQLDGATTNDGPAPDDGSQQPDAGQADAPTDQAASESGFTWQAKAIRFDTLSFKDQVTTQFASEATFTAAAGFAWVGNYSWASISPVVTSPPNFLCVGDIGTAGPDCCNKDLYVDFIRPVRNLKFKAMGVENLGKVAQVRVFRSGTYAQTVDVLAPGSDAVATVVDLSQFDDITRIELVNVTDVAGLCWDDFEFDLRD
jgi:hypothetical protein